MEALGSPSISRARMGGGHAFRKLVYAGNRHNDIHHRSLPEIYFRIFPKDFWPFVRFCLFLFGLFFFCESTHYEKQKKKQKTKKNKQKKNIKITTIYMIYKPV